MDATDKLVLTAHEVGKVNPQSVGLQKRHLPSNRGQDEAAQHGNNKKITRRHGHLRERRQVKTGTVRNLVVMVRFADHVNRTLPSAANLNVLFNNVGPASLCPTGSVRDVWYKNSYGALTIQSVMTDWITVSQTEIYSADANRYAFSFNIIINEILQWILKLNHVPWLRIEHSGRTIVVHQALREALTKADAFINFKDFDIDNNGQIDMVTFIHSGYAAECMVLYFS